MTTAAPAIEGWFAADPHPHLLGNKCTSCGTYVFPPTATFCPSPACFSDSFDTVPLSRSGTIWSYTDAQYKPPPPYISTSDPFEPFAIAAVALEDEGMVVMGQVADGYTVADLRVGMQMELVIETLFTEDDVENLIWRWTPVTDISA